MIQIKKDHLRSGHRLRPGTTIAIKAVCIHSTGNPSSTALNERAWLDNPDNKREASWHYCIDEKNCVEAIPPKEMAWHAGVGNKESISIEICESGNRAEVLKRAAEFAAQLLKEHGLSIEALKRHYDYTQKTCPFILSSNNWAGWKTFKDSVNSELKKLNTTAQTDNWKTVEIDYLESEGIKFDYDYWKQRIDEPMPAWAVFIFMARLYKKLKK